MPGTADHSLRRFPTGSAQRFAQLRRPATPRNASQRPATRLQPASRGLDSLNGQRQCTCSWRMLGDRMSLPAQPLHNVYNIICVCMFTGSSIHMRNYIVTTSGVRLHSHMSIHDTVCAHTARDRQADYTAKERDFPAKEGDNIRRGTLIGG